ncbi:mpv17-like protein 2 [Oppia nitens]|uniref:mpv17-like protein 2 n=1 Tax=Oppia nitens TaxID=1686743 RepID=UPI0023DC1258|nr:mpv17-like protein 2 [Oppia nitens]
MIVKTMKRVLKVLYSTKYLMITNCMTGIVSVTIGDSVQQIIEFKTDSLKDQEFGLNIRRNVNMSFAGLYFGVFGHFWYGFLDKRFPGANPSQVLKKLMAEMAMGPPLVSGLFLIISKFKGKSLTDSWTDLKSQFVLICTVEWLVYIPLQYINFSFVSPKYRYLFVATISLCYDAFLSYVIYKNDRLRRLKTLGEDK